MHSFAMAARATRPASGAASSSGGSDQRSLAEPHEVRNAERTLIKLLELCRRSVLPTELLPALDNLQTALTEAPCSRCLLGALSHDELGVIFDGLASPLEPVVAVAFSSTCKGLRTPLQAAFEVLKERHARVLALCRKIGTSCAALRDAGELEWSGKGLTAEHMAALWLLLPKWLPRLQTLVIGYNRAGDLGMCAMTEGLGYGDMSRLECLSIISNNFGLSGAEALAAALSRGALHKLNRLNIGGNPIGNQGVSALAAPLRKQPLRTLFLHRCQISDEGVASLVANIGKDDFKNLERLCLAENQITNKGCAMLSDAIKSGAMPSLEDVDLAQTDVSAAAREDVLTEIRRAKVRRAFPGNR